MGVDRLPDRRSDRLCNYVTLNHKNHPARRSAETKEETTKETKHAKKRDHEWARINTDTDGLLNFIRVSSVIRGLVPSFPNLKIFAARDEIGG